MADTPENAPAAKRGKTSATVGDSNATTAKPVKAMKAKEAASTPVATTPAKTAATANAPDDSSSTAQGIAARMAPLKEQAGKIAKSATDTLNNVDWKAKVDPLKEQAGKAAMSAAGAAKEKTGSAMQGLAKLIADTAATVDTKMGPQYGDYARQAAEKVAGAADTIDGKEVEELVAEARDFVRKSPAVAIGAAAVLGFVLMRLAKGSDDDA